MQRYMVRRDTLGCTYAGYPSDTVEVYLASDADAERVAYGRASYYNGEQYGRACEREEIVKELEKRWGQEGSCLKLAIEIVRSRGESKPESCQPACQYCAEAKPAKVFCNICGCVGHSSISCAYKPEPVLGTNPPEAVEIEHIMFSQHTNWEGRTSRLAEKLNELIDAWNGGKA
jgi:hypothetical protein